MIDNILPLNESYTTIKKSMVAAKSFVPIKDAPFKVELDGKEIHDAMGITVPVALHLDHGSYEGAKAAIEAGFTSVMFDGSHYAFEENLEKSKEMIALAHSKGLSIECEVGGIGGEEDGVCELGISRYNIASCICPVYKVIAKVLCCCELNLVAFGILLRLWISRDTSAFSR